MPQIATLTMNPALDKSTAVDHVIAEHKLRCDRPMWHEGGGGINVSRVIRRLGGQSLAIYPAGGPRGQMIQAALARKEIAQQPIAIDGMTRESFTILERTTELQYRFNMPGPTLSAEEWRRCLEAVETQDPLPDYLVASGSLPPGVPQDFYARVARRAQQQGYRLVLDTSGPPLKLAVEEAVFLLKPNLRELQQLIGEPLESEAEQQQAVMDLIESGRCEIVVLSLGTAGALFASAEGHWHLRSPTVPIRSKVGAGDSMVAGIVWALAQGYPAFEAARLGVAAGAAAVMTPGTDLCHREDVERLYARSKTEG